MSFVKYLSISLLLHLLFYCFFIYKTNVTLQQPYSQSLTDSKDSHPEFSITTISPLFLKKREEKPAPEKAETISLAPTTDSPLNGESAQNSDWLFEFQKSIKVRLLQKPFKIYKNVLTPSLEGEFSILILLERNELGEIQSIAVFSPKSEIDSKTVDSLRKEITERLQGLILPKTAPMKIQIPIKIKTNSN